MLTDKLINYRKGWDQSSMAIADICLDILFKTNETCSKYLGRCNIKQIYCPVITKIDQEIFHEEQRYEQWLETIRKQLESEECKR